MSTSWKQLVKPMIPIWRYIVIDLSDVNFVDSAELGVLVSLKVSAASAAYCSLEFINFSPLVKELLHTTKLSTVIFVELSVHSLIWLRVNREHTLAVDSRRRLAECTSGDLIAVALA